MYELYLVYCFVDIDECDDEDEGTICEHTCTNVHGTFECECDEGFNLTSRFACTGNILRPAVHPHMCRFAVMSQETQDVGSMLVLRRSTTYVGLRRWTNGKSTLSQRLVSAGLFVLNYRPSIPFKYMYINQTSVLKLVR